TSAVAAFGVAVIAFHNQFDVIRSEELGEYGWIWNLLHQPNQFEWQPGYTFATPYPLLPWLGVMAAGYGPGALMLLDRPERRRQLLGLGLALVALFVGLRYFNHFGDPHPWQQQSGRELRIVLGVDTSEKWGGRILTVFSFLDCTKYPPSLLFVLMTLGPAITALAIFDRPIGWLGRPFIVFGRVPLFYSLLHLPLIHGLAVALDYARFGWSPIGSASLWSLTPDKVPKTYGFDLGTVYALWIAVIVFLYPFFYGFMRVKRRYSGGLLSYL